MTAIPIPSFEILSELYSYSPETGEVTSKRTNKVVGSKHRGENGRPDRIMVQCYLRGVGCRIIAAHHIAMAIMNQADIPEGMVVDHIDCNPWNNRWNNLRICTQRENKQNGKKYRKKDFIGPLLPKGVTFHREAEKFRAMIVNPTLCTASGKKKIESLGLFDDPADAGAAFAKRAAELHGEFFRT